MLSAELQRRGGAHSTAGGVGAANVETVATFNVSKASLQLQVDASTRATRRVRDQHASFPPNDWAPNCSGDPRYVFYSETLWKIVLVPSIIFPGGAES